MSVHFLLTFFTGPSEDWSDLQTLAKSNRLAFGEETAEPQDESGRYFPVCYSPFISHSLRVLCLLVSEPTTKVYAVRFIICLVAP